VEVIQRIVRQNLGRMRLCYEGGLRTDATLGGEARVRFIIEPDGAVGLVSDAGSSLANGGVLACIARAFANLSFPAPEGGRSLVVVYSLLFLPPSPA
jgi:hypothetical protein